jgi:Cys-tRNA(Pro)/Cys-tRNA(Cys) deacylase
MVGVGKHGGGGTPALKALTAGRVAFTVLEYAHDPRSKLGFGLEASRALGIPPEHDFKTLIAQLDDALVCAVVPASTRLDTKALAATLGGKRCDLAAPGDAERETGYVVGGISPLGQKRTHRTVIDASALDQPTIVVSGGRRGLAVEVAPADLARVCGAAFAPIARG